MGFESGSLSVRMLYLPKALPEDAVARFARHAAPPIRTLGAEEIHGWVGGRHLLDLPITEANAAFGGYPRLTLMQAERKIPGSLLKATVMMEELARQQAEGKAYLDRTTRSEIRKEIVARLLPTMPPHIRGVPLVVDAAAGIVYAGAVSEKQCDALRVNWLRTIGSDLIPVDATTAAVRRRRADPRDWPATSFSPDAGDDEADIDPGGDFLTWLWFAWETREGQAELPGQGSFQFMIEGPLLFGRDEGDGALEAVVRKGSPLVSGEAKAALLAGKKLLRARLTIARGDDVWSATLDARSFTVRSLKMPDNREARDPVSRFQERMNGLAAYRDMLFALFDKFLDDRTDPAAWKSAVADIRRWVAGRKVKR